MVRGFSHDPFWSSHSNSNDDYDDNDYGIIIRIQTSPNPLLGCPQSSAEKIFPSEDLHFLQIPTLNPMLCICTHSSSHRWGFTIFCPIIHKYFSGWRHISLKFCLMDRRNSPHAVFCQTPPSEKQCAKPSLENMKLTICNFQNKRLSTGEITGGPPPAPKLDIEWSVCKPREASAAY